jgi:hypothetical protein
LNISWISFKDKYFLFLKTKFIGIKQKKKIIYSKIKYKENNFKKTFIQKRFAKLVI